jgi:hypothetical protein
MKPVNILSTAVIGISIASAVSGADAQGARRYAVMEKCMARAQAQWPGTGGSDANQRNRTAAYKACMFAAGQRP